MSARTHWPSPCPAHPIRAQVGVDAHAHSEGEGQLDVQPDELSLTAVNRYLDIKARGVL
jgi:hypothetical protein